VLYLIVPSDTDSQRHPSFTSQRRWGT